MTVLQPIADNIWIFPHDPDMNRVQPSVGVICTTQQTILIDAGNGQRHARRLQAALKKIAAPPVSHIIYTHHHWDHVFGASTFSAPVVAHQLCAERLKTEADKPWSRAYVEGLIRTQPEREISIRAQLDNIDDWESFRIVQPSITFSQNMTLPMHGITLELEHVGGDHAPDSIVVRIKDAGVMFVGDCFYPGRGQTEVNFQMIERLMSDSAIDIFIHSHGAPVRRENLIAEMS